MLLTVLYVCFSFFFLFHPFSVLYIRVIYPRPLTDTGFYSWKKKQKKKKMVGTFAFINQELNFFSFVLLFDAISPLVWRLFIKAYDIAFNSQVCIDLIDLNFTLFQIANMIRFLVDSYNKPVPAILEIPSKDHPYDPAHDSLLSRVRYLFSAESVASGRRWIILSCSHATNHSISFVLLLSLFFPL